MENVEHLTPDVPSSPNALSQFRPATNVEDLSQPGCFFLNVSGGNGKTSFINAIQNCLKLRGKSVIAVGASAVAVKIIKRIRKSLFLFIVPVLCGADDTCHVSVDLNDAQKSREVSLGVWNEIAMCHGHCFKHLDLTLKEIM